MKRNHDIAQESPESLLKELKTLVAEAEKIMAKSGDGGELLENIRDRFQAAQERFGDIYEDTRKKITVGAKRTDEAIRSNPYQSLAVAVGVGVLLGMVAFRRK